MFMRADQITIGCQSIPTEGEGRPGYWQIASWLVHWPENRRPFLVMCRHMEFCHTWSLLSEDLTLFWTLTFKIIDCRAQILAKLFRDKGLSYNMDCAIRKETCNFGGRCDCLTI
jgi:hypothetical protein